jgi:hypothetical protein
VCRIATFLIEIFVFVSRSEKPLSISATEILCVVEQVIDVFCIMSIRRVRM